MRKSTPAIQVSTSSNRRVYRSIRTMVLVSLACFSALTLPCRLSAQSVTPPPAPARQLTERLDALERDNAAMRAENARLESFIRGRFPDFAQGTIPAGGMQPGSSSPFLVPAGQN